jgi:Arc/MetJ-type ribon-helix-helix transcriptional regulator
MTVKTAVSFTERHHQFAKQKVQEGSCASVSSLVAQGIEKLMLEEQEREAVLSGMADAIKARMQTPRSEFIEMDETDTMFDNIRERLRSG